MAKDKGDKFLHDIEQEVKQAKVEQDLEDFLEESKAQADQQKEGG